MSALQKYKAQSEQLAKQLTELQTQLEQAKETAAWMTVLCLAPPIKLGIYANIQESLKPELTPSKQVLEQAIDFLSQKYPGKIPNCF